jgi:hypothetical protein
MFHSSWNKKTFSNIKNSWRIVGIKFEPEEVDFVIDESMTESDDDPSI